MGKVKKPAWSAADYERAAKEYSGRLPLEHFMEALPQATQRRITLASFDLLSDVQVFNELLIQYMHRGRLRRVVPDNMARPGKQALQTIGSFNIELESIRPLLVMEYVSPESLRKDYKESFRKYERELKVQYCLIFYPERQDLRFWRHSGTSYEAVAPDAQGRYAVPELRLELGLYDRWVRFWHQGELLLLPADLQQELGQVRERAERAEQRAVQAEQRADQAESELARLRELLARTEADKPKGRRGRNGT